MSTTFLFQINGQSERMNQTLEQYFRFFAKNNKHKLVELLPTTKKAIKKIIQRKCKTISTRKIIRHNIKNNGYWTNI